MAVVSATSREKEQREANQHLNASKIVLPKHYNPVADLNQVEMLHNFVHKTSGSLPVLTRGTKPPHGGGLLHPGGEGDSLSSPLTSLLQSRERLRMGKKKAMDAAGGEGGESKKVERTISSAEDTRRVRDVQAVACVMVEMFLPSKIRVLGPHAPLEARYALCRQLVQLGSSHLPLCLRHTLKVLFQLERSSSRLIGDHQTTTATTNLPPLPEAFDAISMSGLPPPTPHLLLQPLVDVFPFPSYFLHLFPFVTRLKQFERSLAVVDTTSKGGKGAALGLGWVRLG